MQSTFNSEISQAVEPMLAFFVSNFNIHKISFPLLPNTYTLWRTRAYQAMHNLPYYKASPQAATYEFYLISQTVLLHNFADRLLQQIQSTQPKDTFGSYSQEYKIGNQLIQKYNKALEIHSLYAELFEDITKLPYLADAFPPARKYKLAETYTPKIVAHCQKEEVGQKFSSGLLNKGIGFITEKLFTKTFLLQASSIAVKLNPIAMIASFAFAQLIEKLKKEKKGLQISQKILETLLDIEQKVQNLKNAYQQCIGLLGPALKLGGESRGKVISAIKQIMIEDWLQIQTIKDDDGWQVVILNNLETPQMHKQTQ